MSSGQSPRNIRAEPGTPKTRYNGSSRLGIRYKPNQGDIVMMNFTPQAGHEQGGKRSALVISNAGFHRYTRMAIVCPITTKIKDYPYARKA